jgi:hypothetical protein
MRPISLRGRGPLLQYWIGLCRRWRVSTCRTVTRRERVMGARPLWYRSRATATGQRFFAFGKTALSSLPALHSTYPTGVRPGTDEWRFARRARSLEGETAGRGSPAAFANKVRSYATWQARI